MFEGSGRPEKLQPETRSAKADTAVLRADASRLRHTSKDSVSGPPTLNVSGVQSECPTC